MTIPTNSASVQELKEAHRLLKAGFALIAEEKNWTKQVFARNSEGLPVASDSEDACKFCSIGALNKVSFIKAATETEEEIVSSGAMYAGDYLCNAVDEITHGATDSVVQYNDAHTHEEVKELWALAIMRVANDIAKRGESV